MSINIFAPETPEGTTAHPFDGGLLQGTQVRTPCGPRRIEHVRAGDLIVTRTKGLQPVRMVWRRELRDVDLRGRPEAAPVRLKTRAIGPMMPQQDLVLAPEHPVLVPGYRLDGLAGSIGGLMEAGELAGTSDAAYVDRSLEEAPLFHLVFDSHQIFMANGLPVGSVDLTADVLERLEPSLRDEVLEIFPRLNREPAAYPGAEFCTVTADAYRHDAA